LEPQANEDNRLIADAKHLCESMKVNTDNTYLGPNETELAGSWLFVDGRVVGDESCLRIDRLRNGYLQKVATDPSGGGWTNLFRDPGDGRLWELDYPQGELQGGGPPGLRLFTPAEAAARYSLS
jgi:hypothetical protein